ncbi:VCBS repeat-containing protein, partial [Ekhidna lutea]
MGIHYQLLRRKSFSLKNLIKQFFIITVLLQTSLLFGAPGRSDTPIISTDVCGLSLLTQITGTSTESEGSIINLYLRTSLFDTKVLLGSTTVNSDGTWRIAGLNLTSGLLSATATASGEVESLPSAEIELTVPPVISQGVLSHPTICGVLDGSLQLLGFLPFTEYTIQYTDEDGFQSLNLTSDALGSVTITGLGDGELQEIQAVLNGCVSNTICSVELEEPSIPSFTLGVPVQPVVCGGTGSILITGAPLAALDYDVSYFDGNTTVSTTITSDGITGIITISGLSAGTYSNFQVSRNGCDAGLILDRITIFDGLLPSTVTLGTVTQPSTCTSLDGEIQLLGVLALTSYDVSYENKDGVTVTTTIATGAGETTVALPGLGEGVYRNLRVESLGCSSTPLAEVSLSSLPTISLGSILSPLSCLSADGYIEIEGLISGEIYDIRFQVNEADQLVSLTANSSGILEIENLESGSYTNFLVEQGDCQSNILDDIISLDEIAIPEISLSTTQLPSACAASDGEITLLGLLPGTTYDVSYRNISGLQTVSITADAGTGELTIPNLSADEYSDISVSLNGCSSNSLVCPINLDVVPALSLGVVTPETTCGAEDGTVTLLGLTGGVNYDISYVNIEGQQSLVGVPSSVGGTITLTGLAADTYSNMTVSLGGCSSEPLADISLGSVLDLVVNSSTIPTSCGATDGSIVLSGLTGSSNYDVTYSVDGVATTTNLNSVGGLLTLSGLGAGTYSGIKVNDGSCDSNTILNAIDLNPIGIPSVSLGLTVNPTSCGVADGSISLAGLVASTAYSVNYTNSAGVQTASLSTDALGVLTISGLEADDYQDFSVELSGCESNVLEDIVSLVDLGTPAISLGTITSPTVCSAMDGSIELTGLVPSTPYNISYSEGGADQTIALSANADGELVIPNLSAGIYENIKVEAGGCLSVSVGPLELECFQDAVYTILNKTIDQLNNTDSLAYPTDADGAIVCAQVKSGTLPTGTSINAESGVIYVSTEGDLTVGSSTVSILTVDAKGDTTQQDVTVVILNDTPDAQNDSYTVDEGATLSVNDADGSGGNPAVYGVIVNDSDIANAGLTVTKLTDPANHNGTFVLDSDGTFVYTHDGSETTTDSFTYRLSDGMGETADATVTFTINPQNDAPVAVADTYTFDEGSTNNVNAAIGVLNNDSDPDGDAITAILVGDVSNGTLTLNVDGSFDYTHDGTETTSDSFTYKVNDGTVDGNTVEVTLNINGVNDAPVAVADSYTFDKGSSNSVNVVSGVLTNDSDADGDALSAILVTDVSNGTLALNSDGSFDYTHDNTSTTSDAFTYKVNDGTTDGNTVSVTLTIVETNPNLVTVADSYTFDEGSNNSVNAASGVLDNDVDNVGSGITAELVSDVSFGTLTLNADGGFTYTHDGSETTVDSFEYRVTNGTDNGNAVTVTLNITPQNDAPVAVADTYTFDEGSTNNVSAASGVLDNDSDADGDTFTAILVSDVSNGTLTLNADGSFDYEHDGSETTVDSFTYKVNDGTVDGNTVTVTLNITPQNDAPVAVADTYTFDEGSTNNVSAASGVLDNDSDADGDTFTAILVSDVSNGTLTLNADGSFDYEHDGSETTVDSFTYKVNDGTVDGNTVTVTLNITPQNDAPVAVADTYTFDEGSTNNVSAASGVLDNDSDADGDTFTSILVSDVSNGTLTLNVDGSFDYEHDGSETTVDSFTYKVNDGTVDGNTVTVTLNITPQNDAPVAVADTYTFDEGSTNNVSAASGVLDNDSDADGDT